MFIKLISKRIRELILSIIDNLLFVLSFISVISIVFYLGFDIEKSFNFWLPLFFKIVIQVFLIALIFRVLFHINKQERKAVLFFEFFSLFVLLITITISYISPNYFHQTYPLLFKIVSKALIYIIIIMVFIIELSKKSMHLFVAKLNPALLFILSFIFIILIGSSLLMLPKATVHKISFVDALFTATSAVCVTGLTTLSTGADFTFLGKSIILLLIQLGGLGVMTFTSFFGLFFMGSSSFKSNFYLKDFINTESINDIYKRLFKIIFITLLIEGIGVVLILINLPVRLFSNSLDELGFAIFHSVSAFCNAGFSTLDMSFYDLQFRYNYSIHLTIAFLVIIGGIGFPIIFNYYKLFKIKIKNFFRKIFYGEKYSHIPNIINVHSRIVLITTLLFLLGGSIIFFCVEYNNTLKEYSLAGKMVEAFFCSVTPRTAGFNTVNVSSMLPISWLIIIFLMWVGASPGSTGGGIKTTTFAIAVMNVVSITKGKDRIETVHREISYDSIRKAFAIILLSLFVLGTAILLVSIFDAGKPILALVFECFSAFGTVGLSLNITPYLSVSSKYVIIATMFIGRVGALTIIVAILRKVKTLNYRYPKENVIVG